MCTAVAMKEDDDYIIVDDDDYDGNYDDVNADNEEEEALDYTSWSRAQRYQTTTPMAPFNKRTFRGKLSVCLSSRLRARQLCLSSDLMLQSTVCLSVFLSV